MDCCWHHKVDFLDYSEGKYGSCPTLCYTGAQYSEKLGKTRKMYIGIRARTPWLEEASSSDSEMVSDGDDEHYEAKVLRLQVPTWQ